jgi:hypothetical protein
VVGTHGLASLGMMASAGWAGAVGFGVAAYFGGKATAGAFPLLRVGSSTQLNFCLRLQSLKMDYLYALMSVSILSSALLSICI